jgi:immunoglobulin superfamily member 9B
MAGDRLIEIFSLFFSICLATGRPDQVHNCTITNISMTSMSIRCSEGFNGGLNQQFMLEVRDSQTSELRANTSSPVPRFTVNSLMPSAIYMASVYAFNAKGRSDPTNVQAAMLRMPEKPTGEKGKKEFCRPVT